MFPEQTDVYKRQEQSIPKQQKIKKKKEGEEYKPLVDIRNLPAPHKIKAKLDEYVVGQEYAKKVMSVAVYNLSLIHI